MSGVPAQSFFTKQSGSGGGADGIVVLFDIGAGSTDAWAALHRHRLTGGALSACFEASQRLSQLVNVEKCARQFDQG